MYVNSGEWEEEWSHLFHEKASHLKRLHHEIEDGIEGEPKPIKSHFFDHEDLYYYYFDKMSNE